MTEERRRFFRINDRVGIAYRQAQVATPDAEQQSKEQEQSSRMQLVSEQDRAFKVLLSDARKKHPEVADLIAALDDKLDRVMGLMMLETQRVDGISSRVREANISACGIAFINDEPIKEGTLLNLDLTLFPGKESLSTQGMVIDCYHDSENASYYWRIDFYAMRQSVQEKLIQHIVQRQSVQLRNLRED